MNAEITVDLVLEMVQEIRPFLAGHPLGVRAAVLTDLLGYHLAEFAPDARREMLDAMVRHAINLAEIDAHEQRRLA